MATFEYTARDASGNEYCGTYRDISGVAALRAELEKIGYVLVRARQERRRLLGATRIGDRDVAAFAYKFAGMYSAGLSVIACLETLESQAEKESFRRLIAEIRHRVEVGTSLAKAFEPHGEVFSEFFVGMLEAGEAAGKLSEALEMSAAYLEKKAQLRTRIREAMVYPITIGVICLGVLTALLVFVVPVFSKLYASMRVPLPGPTLLLVGISNAVRHWAWLVLPLLAAMLWGLARVGRDARVREVWGRLKLRLPLIGGLNRLILVARFIRPFAMLTSVGVSVIDGLRISGRIARNAEVARIAQDLRTAAQAGRPVGTALATHDLFPPVILQMAASGEQVGALAEMLSKGVDILDRDIETKINALVVKLEPVLTLLTGLVVGLFLIGVYLPMLDYMTHLQ